MQAIESGAFYSSNGPIIHDITVADGKVSVKASEVRTINFVANVSQGRSCIAAPGEVLTEAEFKIRGSEKYIRIECVDADGNTAWSNPIFAESLS